MIVTRQETQRVEVVNDVICNKCGKSCKSAVDGIHETAALKARWGYGSRKDTENHE